jgi:dihydrofolate reductase
MDRIPVALIAAVADNHVIGDAGGMPWRLRTDMRRFRRLTMGKPIVMGRRQWDTVGHALPGRPNLVVSRRPGLILADAEVLPSIAAALARGRAIAEETGAEEVMVIGGGEIYAQTMDEADRLYITHVHADPAGDTMFPAIDSGRWTAVFQEAVPAGPDDSAATDFTIYERRAGSRS